MNDSDSVTGNGAYSWVNMLDALSMIASHESMRNILHQITRNARVITSSFNAAIALHASDNDTLNFCAVDGEMTDQLLGLHIRTNDSIAGKVLEQRRTMIMDEGIITDTSQGEKTRNSMVPIFLKGDVHGVLIVQKRTDQGDFTEENIAALESLSCLAGIALENDSIRDSANEAIRELTVLYDTTKAVNGTLNVHEVINGVLGAICKHLEYQSAVLFLMNDEKTHLFIAADRGLNEDEREVQLSAEAPIISTILDSDRPALFVDEECLAYAQDIPWVEKSRSIMISPIGNRQEAIGLIIITSSLPSSFTRNDLRMLNAATVQAGIALANASLYEEELHRAEEATALYELSQHVNATLNLDRIFQFISGSVTNLLKVDRFALMLYDQTKKRLVTRVSVGLNDTDFVKLEPEVGKGIPGWVFEWMTPTAVADVSADSRNRSCPIHQYGVCSVICAPMSVGEECIGVMLAMSSTRRFFTVAEIELLYTISNQVSVGVVNSMLYHNARVKSTEMRRLIHRIARALGSVTDSSSTPQLLSDICQEVMKAERCLIYRIVDEKLYLNAISGFRSSFRPDEVVVVGDGLTGWVAKRARYLSVDVLDEDPRSEAHSWLKRDKLCSYLGVPLKYGHKTVGVVEIYMRERYTFTEDDIRILTEFLRQTGIGVAFDTGLN